MNKFCIQIVLFLLIISVYVNIKILATEADLGEDTSESTPNYLTSEEIYEKNKHLLYTEPEETINADEFMKEAVSQLVYHATSKDDYELCGVSPDCYIALYKKKHEGHTTVKKIYYSVYDFDQYNEIINELWDPDHASFLNIGSVKIVRVYNPNLVMIQQRYQNLYESDQKYFYALATKVEISKNKTIVAISSANINDHNRKNKKYFENTIVESANLFQAEVDSEEDIRKGKLKKTFVNIAGYLIENKGDCVNITYIESVSDIHILLT
ncbi:hypothetical protein YYC_02184 [Plasmodium yoelii 17X]|uniref:Fam-a protein n=1 Tax=Plasmodium yoelii 17X TaxID=1323249 RepID=V7PPU1_PLAYE|nr:hypothetical protein YYC_02184 [Plasmodium yoelii 17X]